MAPVTRSQRRILWSGPAEARVFPSGLAASGPFASRVVAAGAGDRRQSRSERRRADFILLGRHDELVLARDDLVEEALRRVPFDEDRPAFAALQHELDRIQTKVAFHLAVGMAGEAMGFQERLDVLGELGRI